MATLETKENVIAASDLSKWRLKNERGRQTWWYDADGEFDRDPNFLERHSLGLDTVSMQKPCILVISYAHTCTMHTCMYLMDIQCICILCTYNAYVHDSSTQDKLATYEYFVTLLNLYTQSEFAPALPSVTSPREAAKNGMLFYSKLQADDGHWAGDYGGPLFLMAGM